MPIVAAIIGAIISGLTAFFAQRAGVLLMALGVGFVAFKGLSTLVAMFVTQIQAYVGSMGSVAAAGLGVALLDGIAYVGFFDSLNIIIAGYLTYYSFLGVKTMLARL